MICGFCGSQIDGKGKNCKYCGAPITQSNTNSSGTYYERVNGEEIPPNMNNKATQRTNYTQNSSSNSTTMAIVAYLTWIGFIVAFVSNDKDTPLVKFHLNQALVLNLFGIIGPMIPIVGWAAEIVVFVFFVMGIIGASRGEMNELPIIGSIKLLK